MTVVEQRRWRRAIAGGVAAFALASLVVGAVAPAASAAEPRKPWTVKNFALEGRATQSSTYPWLPNVSADKAIDGNTSGNVKDGSITHADTGMNPWWQVDLGKSVAISELRVYNRTDCCFDRLHGAKIFISNTPFDTSLSPAEQEKQPGVHTEDYGQASYTKYGVRDYTGRYILVQKEGWTLFSLAEVEVLGIETAIQTVKIRSQYVSGSALEAACIGKYLYLTMESPDCSGSTLFDIIPNDANGTVQLRTRYGGNYVRYAPGQGPLPFRIDGNGNPNDPAQGFLILKDYDLNDGTVRIRNADGSYWRILDDGNYSLGGEYDGWWKHRVDTEGFGIFRIDPQA